MPEDGEDSDERDEPFDMTKMAEGISTRKNA